jgi:hypothetical protein
MYPDLTAKPDVYEVNVEISTTNNYECVSKQITNVYFDNDLALFHVSNKYCVILNNLRTQERSRKSELNVTLKPAGRGKNFLFSTASRLALSPHSASGLFPGSKAARA